MLVMKQRSGVLVIGQTGAGKSTLIREHIVPRIDEPVIVLDIMGEYEYGVHFKSARSMFRAMQERDTWGVDVLVLRPSSEEDESLFWYGVAAWPYPAWVVCDEVDLYLGKSSNQGAVSILRRGRHTGKSFVFAARRPYEIIPDLRAQVDLLIVFRLNQQRDIDYVESFSYDSSTYPPIDRLDLVRETSKASQYVVYPAESPLIQLFDLKPFRSRP